MATLEDELRMDEEENRREVAFIHERLPQEFYLFRPVSVTMGIIISSSEMPPCWNVSR